MVIRVKLIRKLADALNGVDLSKIRVGDCLDLPARHAWILMAEGWAELVETNPKGADKKLKQGC